MNTVAEFLYLPLNDKIKHLFSEGSFVVSIRYYRYKINLYLIDGFYVEVFYLHKEGYIEKIELLDRRNTRMKFYTDQIKLPPLWLKPDY
jgi:hypothetical protein